MKYYKELMNLPVFNLGDASKVIGSKEAALKNLERMLKGGYLHKIRKNLYTFIDLSSGADCGNRFQIGSNITEDSFISYHSAFEFYGYFNQMFFINQITSTKRFSPFDYDGFSYQGYSTKTLAQVDFISGIRVSSIERTIIDSINMLGKTMDVEELLKCLELVDFVDEKKLIEMLSIYNKEILYRKAGYVLSFYKGEFSISDDFISLCRSKGVLSNKGFLSGSGKAYMEYVPDWGLYGYKNIRKLIDKGGNLYV